MIASSPLWIHATFLLFVAISVYAQSVTGFALGLVLLGLTGATGLLPLPDVINVATVLGFFNTWTFVYLRRPLRLERAFWPTIPACAIGIVAGAFIMIWLAGTAYEVLRLILGVSIVVCAVLLWLAAKPLEKLSSPLSFATVGGIAGIMGGMFSTSGPPLVFLLYRQPLPHKRIQESLLLIFGITSAWRLCVVVFAGQFSLQSFQLALEALPVVILVTFLAVKYPPAVAPRVLKAVVCVLLVATGLGMVWASLGAAVSVAR